MIAGRYRLGEMIGEGGMARVWRAVDTTLARDVAVKFLFLREGREQDSMVARFLREARIAAAVRHPNVVDILDFGTTDDERPFMVMELLSGESLEDRMQRDPTLTLEELVRIVTATLDGLAAVHKSGIVHRDLKPDNVFLLDDDGEIRPKVLDFGVSRDTDPTSGRRSALTTGDGYLVGTPEYMSPEQARGLSDIDHRSDIYSVGVILYETMTGRLPYDADAVGDLIIDIVQGGADPVCEVRPEVGEALSAVVARAMSAKREERFDSARQMRDALLEAAEESLGMTVRSSLPLMRPARHALDGTPRPRSDVHTIDDVEIEVESPRTDDGVDRGSGTPGAWDRQATVSTGGARWGWIAAALVLPLAAAGAWWASTQAADAVEDSRDPVTVAPTALTAPVEASDEDEAAPAEGTSAAIPAADPDHVTVTLRGLPRAARVNVDGAWVETDGERLTLPRDRAEHRVTVVAEGRRPWRLTHVADGDAAYRVRLRRGSPNAAPDDAPAAEPMEEATATSEGGNAEAEPADSAPDDPAAPAGEVAPPAAQQAGSRERGGRPSGSAQDAPAEVDAPAAATPPPEPDHDGVFRDLDY